MRPTGAVMRSAFMTEILEGGCACGRVRFKARGAPKRVGLCHCLTCRKAHGAAFFPFAVYERGQVLIVGELKSWLSSPDYDRAFCPNCGSPVIGRNGAEVEVSLGSFDRENVLALGYESWIRHREHWLAALPVSQFEESRPLHPSQ